MKKSTIFHILYWFLLLASGAMLILALILNRIELYMIFIASFCFALLSHSYHNRHKQRERKKSV